MTIDIRANVYCSLGPVISGSFSDDYIQDSGLIKTRGEVLLKGIYRPEIGTVVEFAYIRDGIASRLPRKLRVLSVFSDPYRGTTNIALGCLLSYLNGRRPPIKNPTSVDENGETPPGVISIASLPISATYVFEQCLAELGLATDQNPLTNKFSVEEFALDSGYIQVISDLLKSEGYFGFINEEEILTVRPINAEGGLGPVIGIDEIIDISPIDVGELPGDSVLDNYSYLKLQRPGDEDGVSQDESGNYIRNYTSNSSIASEVTLTLEGKYLITRGTPPYPDIFNTRVWVESYYPTTYSEQTYTLLDTTDPKTGQQSKRWLVTKEEQKSNAHSFEAFSGIILGFIEAQRQTILPWASGTFEKIRRKTYTYDSAGRVIREDTVETGPAALVYSALPVPWKLFFDNILLSDGTFPSIKLAESTTITRYYEELDITETSVFNYKPRGFISETQNEFAREMERLNDEGRWSLGSGGLTTLLLLERSKIMTFDSSSFTISQGRGEMGTGGSGVDRVGVGPLVQEDTAGIELINGSAESQLVVEFSIPYSSDDYLKDVSGSGPTLQFTIVPSDAPTKARNYGSLQNRLLLGNRNGLSLQVSANSMPAIPFSPIYIEADGLIAEYRTNGTSYTFDANGIVASTDALFWGGVGES